MPAIPSKAKSSPSTTSAAPPAASKPSSTPAPPTPPTLPSSPTPTPQRRHHAQQGRLPCHEGLLHLRPPVLRFNFRGTGLSEGTHDHGIGEQDDVRAAIDYLDRTFAKPILVAGFSFGANVALRACCGDPRVAGLIGLGIPVRAAGRDYTYGFLPGCTAPKLFLSGTNDQFGRPK